MRLLILLFLLAAAAFGCEGTVSQYVPAIVGNGGGLIEVSISLAPGEGDVYAKTYPHTGMDTQQSMEQAVDYAYLLADDAPVCNVMFKFEESAGYIEGPSGGAAFTVMTYALLENRSMRSDAIITGTISPTGDVGPVGGTYEKAKGAAAVGARYFITPVSGLYEALVLRNIEEESGIIVLEAARVEDIIGFMMENKSIEQVPLDARKREIPELPSYEVPELEPFIPVAERMIELERNITESITGNDNETVVIREFYDNEAERQDALLEQGYAFSSANEAFLNYIDIGTIAAISKNSIDLPRKKGEVGICLTGIERPDMTDVNFEWIVGSRLREAWAYGKYNDTEIEGLLTDEKYAAYHELMYGDAWCNVAKSLIAEAPEGGSRINETVWKELAEEKIDEAGKMASKKDMLSRLEIAEKSFDKGYYGAAIFDAVYVIEMERSDLDIINEAVTEDNVEEMLDEERTSLWGAVYQSHAAFLYEIGEINVAYTTLRLAKGLDRAVDEMKELLEEEPEEAVEEIEMQEETDNILLGAFIISLFLFIIVIILIRRAYGSERKRYGKANRAKQKKGRA